MRGFCHSSLCWFAAQSPGFDGPLAFDFDIAAPFKRIRVGEILYDTACDLDCVWYTVCFHPACEIHGIAPEVVDEFVLSDYASHDWAGVNSDPQPNRRVAVLTELSCDLQQSQRHRQHAFGVVRAWLWQTTHRHVGITDR